MRYLYSAFLRPKQSRIATEWHVLTGSHSFTCHSRPSWLYSVSIHQMATRTRQYTSDIAYYLIYRSRKKEWLSWPGWLTYSGRFTHISGHQQLQVEHGTGKVCRSKTNVLNTVQRNQPRRYTRERSPASVGRARPGVKHRPTLLVWPMPLQVAQTVTLKTCVD